MKKTFYSALLLVSLASFSIYYKTNLEELIVNKLEAYGTISYPEKIYIHTDKPYYSLEETIWFTGYMVNGIDHLKSNKSFVVHVDLINENDSILDSKKLFIKKISSAGDFKISKDWKPGKYLIRAYTNEMRNEDSAYFFQKEISVLAIAETTVKENNIAIPSEKKTQEYKIPKPDIHFYPEGGYIVEGVQNKIAVKIKDKIFQEQNLKGTIVDNENNEISTFKTSKYGLAAFILTPEPNKTYTAIVDINGSEESYSLPKTQSQGYTISVINQGKRISITVNSTLETGLQKTLLVGHQRGKHLYSKLETSTTKTSSLSLYTSQLKDGIIHFTLFNPEGNPVAERLIYIENPKNKITVAVNKNKNTLGTREKITININPKDVNGNNVSSHLSMSVRDLQAIPQNRHVENIKTWLLLNSDLRGEIENPGYFFEVPNDYKRRYLLDLTMMTHGWRRFTWKSLLKQDKKAREFPIEKGVFIKGRTKYLKKPYDYRSTATRITFLGDSFHQEVSQSDTLGNFTYGPFILYDSVSTLIEARLTNFKSTKSKDRKVVILLENTEPEKPIITKKTILKPTIRDEEQLAAYIKISKYIKEINTQYNEQMRLLDEVIIVAKKKDKIELRNEEFDSRTNYGYAQNRLIIEDMTGAESYSILDLLNQIGGVMVSGSNVTIRGVSPTFYLDGMEIDIDFVETLSGNDIDFMDVLKGADAVMFANSGGGAIAMYSKTGFSLSTRNIKRKPGIIDFKTIGFYTAREFYSPDHINGFEEISKADVRTTLHWEPQIRVTENNTPDISFFSCDRQGDYIIEIQGISDTGTPIYDSSILTVE